MRTGKTLSCFERERGISLTTVDRIYKNYSYPKIKAKNVVDILKLLNFLKLGKVILDQ